MSARRFIAPWHRDDLAATAKALELRGQGPAARALLAHRGKPAICHCVSHLLETAPRLDAFDKEHFVSLLRAYEKFCQLRVLSYCAMDTRTNLLVEVPPPPAQGLHDWSDQQFLEHLAAIRSPRQLAAIREQITLLRSRGEHAAIARIRDPFAARMWNLVEFMKTLKQTFSRRVNRHHEHCGTIWDERYKLVLVEPGHAARTLSAYIDLSPVREGFVTDPRDYRWCGYAAAVTGHPGAREAIQRLVSNPDAPDPSDAPDAAGIVLTWPAAAGRYRELLSARPPDGKQKTRSRTKRTTGKLKGNPRPLIPESQALHRHVRHFEDGLVIGSAEFVENVFQWSRDHFGPKRKNGPRKIRGIDTRLRSMRDLRD